MRIVTLSQLDALPGLVHGFELRPGPNGTETRAAARQRVTAELGPRGALLLLHQVHGAQVHAAPWDGTPDGDGGVALAPGWLLGIETADCLPVLLVDPVRRAVAAVHAGWRGTAQGIARAGVAALVAHGSRPADLVAGLGPAIGPCCYEVGDELRTHLLPQCFRSGPRGRPHLDVPLANVLQLRAAGVPEDQILQVAECTACAPERFHSYRRDGPGAGRMISFVGFAR